MTAFGGYMNVKLLSGVSHSAGKVYVSIFRTYFFLFYIYVLQEKYRVINSDKFMSGI